MKQRINQRMSNKSITKIAKDVLKIETLEPRNWDGYDFYDNDCGSISVWDLKEALLAAYEAGWTEALKPVHRKAGHGDVIFLGTTTLRRMLNAVYDESDSLYSRNTYSECMVAHANVKANADIGNDAVYMYYHRKENKTIMTTIEGDTWGLEGSSAGFEGKVEAEIQTPENKQ